MSRSVEAVCIAPDCVQFVWHKVSHLIKRAIERVDLGHFGKVQADVVNGNSLLWVAWDGDRIKGAAVTQLEQTEKRLVCTIVACGGEDSYLWLHLIEKIEDYARAEGCDCVRIFGRKGWARVLKNYQAPSVILERQL